jgi:DNA polymerase-1
MSTADFPSRPGISDDFLAKAGVTVLADPARLHIPYHDIPGKPTGHFRDRFKSPVTGADGKPQRYSQPFESGMHAYLPPFPFAKGEELYVTEGEFKALALSEAGYNAVALPGLYCYCDQEILPGLLDAVESIAPPTIFFTGDADTLFNLDFYRSAKFLADAFTDIPVRLIQPPLDGPKGVDDVKEETGRRFARWLDDATRDATLVIAGQNFLQTAAIRLVERSKSVRAVHLEKLIKMAVEATKASEPLWAITQLRGAIQKCSNLGQVNFDKSVREKLNEGAEQSIGADHKDELLAHYDWIKNNPWSDSVELSDILQELYDLTKVYIATEDDTRILAALWVGITYARKECPYLPMLVFWSPEKSCGKTNYMTLVGVTAYRPSLLVNVSPASFHRVVEGSKGTFMIDEAKTIADDSLMRQFLNSGFNNSGCPVLSPTVPRYNADTGRMEHFRTNYFKAFAGIGNFLEDDTISRSIMIRMDKYNGPRLRDMSYLNHEDQYAIARKFTAYWTADRLGAFRAQCADVMDRMPSELWDRDKQKFCPLFALAEQAGNGWSERITQASLATLAQPDLAPLSLSQRAMRDAGFVVERELADKAEHKATVLLTKNQRDFIATDALIKTMLVLPEAPWRSYGPSKKILDANGLYYFLKPYGLESEHVRFGTTTARGMYTDKIMEVFNRYRKMCHRATEGGGTTSECGGTAETEPSVDQATDGSAPPNSVPPNSVPPPVPAMVAHVIYEGKHDECATVPPVSEGTPVIAPPFIYVTDEDQLSAILQDLQQPGDVALDIETYYPDAKVTKKGKRMKVAISTVTDRYQSKIRLLQLYRDGSDTVWLLDLMALDSDSVLFHMLRETLAAKDIIGHNITGFDLPWVWEHLRINASHIKDTMTAHRLLYGGLDDAPADLGSVFKRTIQLDLPKDQGSSDWGTETLTEEQLVYAAHDVRHLHDVLRAQEAELSKAKLDTAWKLEKRLAPIVVGMTNCGFGFNLDGVDEAKADLELRLADARHRALAWFGSPELNLNSNIQLLAAFQTKGRHLTATSEEALKADGSEGALLLLEYRNIRDKELKFLTGLSEATRADGRIHAVFNSVGTKTGRFSCKDPNLQNVPRLSKGRFPIRSLFQASPGKKLVIADFAQMELVAAAVLAPEPKMLAAFQAGEDLHCRTASILLGRMVTKDDKANRSLAKAVNFGLLYGQTAPGLKTYAKNSYGVTMSDEESVQFREAFFNEYQGLAAWHERARADANDPGVIEVRTHRVGRRRHLAGVEHWWSRFTSLLNTPIQGSCAEVTKLGLLDIGEKLKGRAQLVSCVHDEIIVECAEYDADAVLAEVQEIMEIRSAQVFNGQKIGVEAHVEDNWAGVKMPTYTDARSTEDATQTELVLSA